MSSRVRSHVLGVLALFVVGACANAAEVRIDAAVDAPVIDARTDAAIDARVDAPTDARVDAATDAAVDAATDAMVVTTCDPLAPNGQSGCMAGSKCTWVVVQDTPVPVGVLGCVPTGTVPLNGACTVGAPGQATGFDNCVEGAICIGGTCQDVCGLNGQANGACAVGNACTRYSNLFANGTDVAAYGACRPTCDPITQNCPANQGCYVLVSNTTSVAVCAGAGTVGQGQQINGTVFANSCLAGYMPRRRSTGSNVSECGALCRPTDVTSTQNQVSEGGVAPNTCGARGAAPPGDPVNGESCRYWWARESFAGLSPFSNTLGWCFRHPAFQYDSNGDTIADAPFPRCINLTTSDVLPPITNPPQSDALYFWCVAMPAMFAKPGTTPPPKPTPPFVVDRLGGWR